MILFLMFIISVYLLQELFCLHKTSVAQVKLGFVFPISSCKNKTFISKDFKTLHIRKEDKLSFLFASYTAISGK